MFATVMGVLGAYVALRAVWPLAGVVDVPVWGRALAVVVILLLAENHLLTRLAYGNMFSLELPRAVVIAVNVGFGAVILSAAFLALVDIVMLLRSLVTWQWRPLAPGWSGAALALGLVIATVGVSNALSQPAQKDLSLQIDGLPTKKGRVQQLSDALETNVKMMVGPIQPRIYEALLQRRIT